VTDSPIDDALLQAALDGELDARGMLDVERARAADPALARRYDQLSALRDALRARAADHRASADLHARIAAMTAGDVADRAPASIVVARRPRLALAASLVAGLALGATTTALVSRNFNAPPAGERVAMLLVDDHRRALLAREPIDVESSDRHTIKPWFDARLALSPPVVDLAASGVTLVGGRADVVSGAPAPTLVYRLREHLISVTALPAARFAPAAATPIDGYQIIAWSDGVFAYWAVSDLPRPDLEAFVAAFKAGATTNESGR
jgi:anti-sigma factor RsiW